MTATFVFSSRFIAGPADCTSIDASRRVTLAPGTVTFCDDAFWLACLSSLPPPLPPQATSVTTNDAATARQNRAESRWGEGIGRQGWQMLRARRCHRAPICPAARQFLRGAAQTTGTLDEADRGARPA